jgi:hypothetical protein
MRSILTLSLLIALAASANAATLHHAHRPHVVVRPFRGMVASDPASSFAYAPSGPPIQYRATPEAYFGASQGYAPGEKEQFLDSVRQGG